MSGVTQICDSVAIVALCLCWYWLGRHHGVVKGRAMLLSSWRRRAAAGRSAPEDIDEQEA
jgi:hypothetical protein